MSGYKYIQRYNQLIDLVKEKKTGSPKKLAKMLGVTERTVYRIIEDFRWTQKEIVVYSKEHQSYVFKD